MSKAEILATLAALPQLTTDNNIVSRCKLCGGLSPLFDVVDFNKLCATDDYYCFGLAGVEVPYCRCRTCGFIFTEFFDDWTTGDFHELVYNSDYIKVDGEYDIVRPERTAKAMAQRLSRFRTIRILDYGAGAGIFAERMRSAGFANVHSYDPYSSPERPQGRFDLLTCFEVLEHTTKPLHTLADMKSLLVDDGCILFSTGVQPANIDEIRCNWWYVAPRNGHASIYSHEALSLLGASAGLAYHVGEGELAFAPRRCSEASASLVGSVGPQFLCLVLTAPDPASAAPASGMGTAPQPAGWHNPEGMGSAQFRWTSRADVEWRLEVPVSPGTRVKLVLPVTMEIEPGFAQRSKFAIGDRVIPANFKPGHLIAEFKLEAPPAETLRLVTPPAKRPCDIGQSPDGRTLGLAVPTASSRRPQHIADDPNQDR